MTSALVVTFLIAHGMVHLAIWAPRPPDAEEQVPFAPDHSGVLTAAHVAPPVTRVVALSLAAVVAALFVLTGLGVALSAGWTGGVAVAAGVAGVVLKLLYWNIWLAVGVLLDLAVVSVAVTGWPLPPL